MLHIALLGYGKMGKAIEEIALKRGHTISLKITDENLEDLTKENISKVNVAIEFSTPESACSNILFCLENNIPVICGTTGWLHNLEAVEKKCKALNGSFLYASNFSVGVNLFFELNKKLASLMKNHIDYNATILEVHHTHKKDAPSGTAITVAEQIIEESPEKKSWKNDATENKSELSIISKRIDEVPGTHSVKYSSDVDDIEIIHTAYNRTGFATGAVLAAEFIKDKKGIFSMKNVLGF